MYQDFGRIKAKGYIHDKFNPNFPIGFKNYIREQLLLKFIHPEKKDIILDVGCASGRQSIFLARKARYVIGVDIAQAFVEEVKNQCERHHITNLRPIVGDIERSPFKDGTFDKIFCGELLEHVIDLDSTMGELYRVLKLNGMLVISVPNENNQGTLWERLKNFIRRSSFEPIKEFSMSNLKIHGDPHLRKFDSKTLKELLERKGFKLVIMKGAAYLDFPLFEKVIYRLNRFNSAMKFLLKIEFRLSSIECFEKFSRSLICLVQKI